MDLVGEIKQRTDLVELISMFVPLKRRGRNHVGLCPFHSEKTPSFNVDGERNFWRCYGCDRSGDCFSFLMEHEGLSFPEAGEVLARRLGIEWRRQGETVEARSERQRLYDLNSLAERYFRQSLERVTHVRDYLAKRGMQASTVEEFGLGYAPDGYEALLGWLRKEKLSIEDARTADLVIESERGLRDRFVDRLMFPIRDLEGRTVAFGGRTLKPDGVPKYLNSSETPIFRKGRIFYGLDRARKSISDSGRVIVVEGYMDLIALHQAGIVNSVASLGTAMTPEHVAILRRYTGADGELILCYDGDSAGIRAALRNSTLFEQGGVSARIATLPAGEDPDTYLAQFGTEALLGELNRATPILDYQLAQLRAEHNLADERERLTFVRRAAQAVAQSGSRLVHQEYGGKLTSLLERLADEWYPGDPQKALQARVSLAQEIRRLLKLNQGRDRGTVPTAPPSMAKSPQAMAERYLLRAALAEPLWADRLALEASAALFVTEPWSELAAEILGRDGLREPASVRETLRELSDDAERSGVLSALVVEDEPVSEEGLNRCLSQLKRAAAQRRKAELWRRVESGEIRPGDAEYDEVVELRRSLGGGRARED